MKARWFRAEAERAGDRRAEFDPVAEGRRHGLSVEVSLTIWDRIHDEAAEDDRLDELVRRFREVVTRVARRGGELQPVPGKASLADPEGASAPPLVEELGARVPGRWTLVHFEPEPRAVAEDEGRGEDDRGERAGGVARRRGGEAATWAIARGGVAGSGGMLPHLARIQASFGRHEVSAVRAHVDARAGRAARAIGARAYATGEDVAFDGAPDLHTVAHEAAHVLQQRAGVELFGGVGRAGDRYEQLADAVADRVVRGESAEPLLDRMVGRSVEPMAGQTVGRRLGPVSDERWGPAAPAGSAAPRAGAGGGGLAGPTIGPAFGPLFGRMASQVSGGMSAVQRQSVPSGGSTTTTTTSTGTTPTTTPATDAPPPSRTATWQQVSDASDDDKGKEKLDIEWIDKLPDHLRNTIDVEFADDLRDAALARQAKVDPELRRLDGEYAQKQKELRADVARRLGVKPASSKVDQDPEYVTKTTALVVERDQAKAAHLEEVKQAHDAAMPAGKREQSVTGPPTAKVKRLEGRALARTNFMSWAIHVTGSADAAKRHFQSIREVKLHNKQHSQMWLAETAAVRFEAALADFEAKHPGYTFPGTDVAQSMRGLHQTRTGVGMLGHALGEAFDFLAGDNPNLRGAKSEHAGLNPFLLTKFGADPQDPKKARATMSLGGAAAESKIEQAGRDTIAGTSSADDDAMVDKVRDQFNEMVATSERFQAAMGGHLQELRDARDLYFEQEPLKAKLADIAKKLKTVDQAAAAQVAKSGEKFTGDAAAQRDAKKARIAEIAAQLRQDLEIERDTTKTALDDSNKEVTRLINVAFASWNQTLGAEVTADTAKQATSTAEATAIGAEADELKPLKTDDELAAFAHEHGLSEPAPRVSAAKYKAKLSAELAGKQQKAKDAAQYDADEIAAVQALMAKLADPKKLFGAGVKQDDGHWATRREVTEVAVMQYLEHGFVRNDAMPASDGKGERKPVFNAEVAATLARFGWSPGATYGDTMHFDFIEGYSLAVPGGRSAKNMNHDRFSPEGDKVVPPKVVPPKPPKAAKPGTHK